MALIDSESTHVVTMYSLPPSSSDMFILMGRRQADAVICCRMSNSQIQPAQALKSASMTYTIVPGTTLPTSSLLIITPVSVLATRARARTAEALHETAKR